MAAGGNQITPQSQFTLSLASAAESTKTAPEEDLTLTNVSTQPLSGTLSLTLPNGWTGGAFGGPESASPVISIPSVPAGATYALIIVLTPLAPVAIPFAVTASMESDAGGAPSTLTQMIAVPNG